MRLSEITLPTPAENVALDEALLDMAEAANSADDAEVLRLWESPQPIVVLGSSSKVAVETQFDVCRQLNVPILRRPSGGAAIMAGPGCLMYAVVLSYERRPALRAVDQAHHHVLETVASGLRQLVPEVRREGISDLAVGGLKVSGNALRCKRNYLLYHGTLLYDFPLDLIARCLAAPPRQPDYRAGRDHRQFVANLPDFEPLAENPDRESDADEDFPAQTPVDRAGQLLAALAAAFAADQRTIDWPHTAVARLVQDKYSRESWNLRY